MMRRQFTTAAVLGLAVACGAARGAIEFSVLPLGQFGNNVHTQLNDLGQVVSSFTVENVGRFAFRTQPNAPFNPATDLLPGTREGYGINNLGQAVGDYRAPNGALNGFRTGPNAQFNATTDALGNFGLESHAYAINNLGQVTGDAGHAFRTRPNLPLNRPTDDLGALGGGLSQGFDINDLGQVVGFSKIAAGSDFLHAFRTAPNAAINPATDDLGTLGGNNSFANAINSLGQVVGRSETGPTTLPRHAFLLQPGEVISSLSDLGTFGGPSSNANDINDIGWVVGSANTVAGDPNQFHAFLYRDGQMIDLNTLIDPALGFQLSVGFSINNRNQILANDFVYGRVCLLTPIPEPSGAALAGCGLLFLLVVARRTARRFVPPLYDRGESHGVASRSVRRVWVEEQRRCATAQAGGAGKPRSSRLRRLSLEMLETRALLAYHEFSNRIEMHTDVANQRDVIPRYVQDSITHITSDSDATY